MSAPHVGDLAPAFSLLTQDRTNVSLADYRDTNPVVLIFYPMDQTPGCTQQLCAARDDADRYRAAGIAVFGVNNGNAASHSRFVERHGLTTPLLVDEGLRVAAQYDAALGFGPLRIVRRTVVGIRRDGRIAFYRRGMPSTDEIIAALAPSA